MPIFIGSDPGTINSAVSIMNCKSLDTKSKLDIEILEISMVTDTITNLTDTPTKLPKSKRRKKNKDQRIPEFKIQFTCHFNTWEDILTTYKPFKVSVERFQSRGNKGSVIESVTIMNGTVATLCHQKSILYSNYIASTWKNSLNKYLKNAKLKLPKSLEDIYTLKNMNLPNHIIDSVFIGIYGLIIHVNKTWNSIKINDIIKQLMSFEYQK